MHCFSSPVLPLSRQQGAQQMVTSVNFALDCSPLEDLIKCGLHALLLILYINTTFISLSLLQLHRAKGLHRWALQEIFYLQSECFFIILINHVYDNIIISIVTVVTLGSSTTEYHKHRQKCSIQLNYVKSHLEMRGKVNIPIYSTTIFRILSCLIKCISNVLQCFSFLLLFHQHWVTNISSLRQISWTGDELRWETQAWSLVERCRMTRS